MGDEYQLHTLPVLTITFGGISRSSVFQDLEAFESFGLSPTLD